MDNYRFGRIEDVPIHSWAAMIEWLFANPWLVFRPPLRDGILLVQPHGLLQISIDGEPTMRIVRPIT